jgi:hypothetical protein
MRPSCPDKDKRCCGVHVTVMVQVQTSGHGMRLSDWLTGIIVVANLRRLDTHDMTLKAHCDIAFAALRFSKSLAA